MQDVENFDKQKPSSKVSILILANAKKCFPKSDGFL